MPVTPLNDRQRLAEIAAANGWSSRVIEFVAKPDAEAGIPDAALRQVVFLRDGWEVSVYYNHGDRMIQGVVIDSSGNVSEPYQRLQSVSEVLQLQEDDDEVVVFHGDGVAEARHQDPFTREWLTTVRATYDAPIWTVRKNGRIVAEIQCETEADNRKAVVAILKAIG